ncbi:sugar phosphate isomerase/epimerase family protein [Dictyobacter arantiisoli]|uniref:Sugar phosphate isomerase n=1 Tax=Dictyobacter arantiisoli TaxID=2014874 RepID=A0A5A5TJD2_9CHLR|nr:sugar phosphate isomerase/epimerase family protein [Dictyobacter arantiisoli]GCF11123.1 sugar phosphate isomerase [Dictyobacter arantiisoli]
MKFAFSTLGCPQWTTEEVADNAVRLGYSGVELRLLDNEVIDPVRDADKVRAAVTLFHSRNLDVCAFDTSCTFNVSDAAARAQNIEALRAWLRLAQELKVPILRVFGGAGSGENIEQENQWVVDALRQVAAQAEEAGVIVTLETHDGFSSARRTAQVLDAIDSPAIAALWDSHHPYRVGESAEQVWQWLGKRVAHVHVKDARRDSSESSGWKLVLMGEGEVPVHTQLQSLFEHGYKGYVSVEWEKYWHPDIEDAEIALPQHILWLHSVEESLQYQEK